MAVAGRLRGEPGVREAAALMGTPANHAILAAAGLAAPEVQDADAGRSRARRGRRAARLVPQTRARAAAAHAGRAHARLRSVAAPPPHARGRPRRAARRQPRDHLRPRRLRRSSRPGPRCAAACTCFSSATTCRSRTKSSSSAWPPRRRLLCMGPDCGTAYLNGVGLGFANVVPRGRVGCVAASGTGLQAVVTRLAALGEGISHGIGVGGRDLSAEVGGTMTQLALETLARDAPDGVIVLISKPPAPAVMPALEAAIRSAGKPVVVCCLGASRRSGAPGTWVGDARRRGGRRSSRWLRGSPWIPRASAIRTPCARGSPRSGSRRAGNVCSGSTRAARSPTRRGCCWSRCSVRRSNVGGAPRRRCGRPPDPRPRRRRVHGGPPASDARPRRARRASARGRARRPRGRPPPRPGAGPRCARRSGRAPGRRGAGGAGDRGARADARCSWSRRSSAPRPIRKGCRAQVDQLRAAGVEVLPSNAQAARFAARGAPPRPGPALLGAR